MSELPLNPRFLSQAKKIVKEIKEDTGTPKTCCMCGDIYFFVSSEKMDMLAPLIGKDLTDRLCDACATKGY